MKERRTNANRLSINGETSDSLLGYTEVKNENLLILFENSDRQKIHKIPLKENTKHKISENKQNDLLNEKESKINSHINDIFYSLGMLNIRGSQAGYELKILSGINLKESYQHLLKKWTKIRKTDAIPEIVPVVHNYSLSDLKGINSKTKSDLGNKGVHKENNAGTTNCDINTKYGATDVLTSVKKSNLENSNESKIGAEKNSSEYISLISCQIAHENDTDSEKDSAHDKENERLIKPSIVVLFNGHDIGASLPDRNSDLLEGINSVWNYSVLLPIFCPIREYVTKCESALIISSPTSSSFPTSSSSSLSPTLPTIIPTLEIQIWCSSTVQGRTYSSNKGYLLGTCTYVGAQHVNLLEGVKNGCWAGGAVRSLVPIGTNLIPLKPSLEGGEMSAVEKKEREEGCGMSGRKGDGALVQSTHTMRENTKKSTSECRQKNEPTIKLSHRQLSVGTERTCTK